MTRNLYVCCREEQRGRINTLIHHAFEDSVTVVTDIGKADAAYVVGKPTPEMMKQVEECQRKGVRTIPVNENLINEEVKEQVYKRFHMQSRERER